MGGRARHRPGLSSGKGYRLTGVKTPVQDAHVADYILVSARTSGGMTQFLIPADAAGLTVERLECLDLSRRFGRVRLEDVEVSGDAVVGPGRWCRADVEAQMALALALQCAETIGSTDRMYEVLLEYVRDRRSFGRPIGSYQAIKHRLVDMLLWLESGKAATVASIKAVQSEIDANEHGPRRQVVHRGPLPGDLAGVPAAARRYRVHLGARPASLPAAGRDECRDPRRRRLPP